MSLTERQNKTLAWVLECQMEITAEKAPDYEPHQALEEIDGLYDLAILLGDPRIISLCEALRVEHQKRVDALPPETETDPLLAIQELMDGVEWSPTTLDQIAQILIKAGYPVRDLDERELDDDPAYDDQGNLRAGDA